jgi:predicted transposase YbfD/YdcC
MVKIAVSDDDYQDLEKHLIAETILRWKIPVHVIEDVEREYADILPNAEELRSHLAG